MTRIMDVECWGFIDELIHHKQTANQRVWNSAWLRTYILSSSAAYCEIMYIPMITGSEKMVRILLEIKAKYGYIRGRDIHGIV